MVPLIVASAIAAWLVISVPVALVLGRIPRRADLSDDPRVPTRAIIVGTGAIAGTGAIGSIRR